MKRLQALVDSNIIGTLLARIQCFTLCANWFRFVWLRESWPTLPSKFHAYPSYRSVHWLLVRQWHWDLLV